MLNISPAVNLYKLLFQDNLGYQNIEAAVMSHIISCEQKHIKHLVPTPSESMQKIQVL